MQTINFPVALLEQFRIWETQNTTKRAFVKLEM